MKLMFVLISCVLIERIILLVIPSITTRGHIYLKLIYVKLTQHLSRRNLKINKVNLLPTVRRIPIVCMQS